MVPWFLQGSLSNRSSQKSWLAGYTSVNLYGYLHNAIYCADITRGDLVGLALLLGCDYCPQGVPGVGREGALKLLAHCSSVPMDSPPSSTLQKSCKMHKPCDLLELFRVWQEGGLLDQSSSFEKRVQRYVFSPHFIKQPWICIWLRIIVLWPDFYQLSECRQKYFTH